jgi:hypothetical protein
MEGEGVSAEGDRRLARVTISADVLLDMVTEGWSPGYIRCIEGLPDGAELVDTSVDERGNIVLTTRHDRFQNVGEGDELPDIQAVFSLERERE